MWVYNEYNEPREMVNGWPGVFAKENREDAWNHYTQLRLDIAKRIIKESHVHFQKPVRPGSESR